MFLTLNEYEAFLRGKAAGLIPADLSLPQNEKEIDNLIFHVGLMFSVRIAYRNRQMKLRLMELSAFTEEHLENIIYRLPALKYPEVAFVTDFKQEIYLNMLESLAAYFNFGSSIISEDDLAGRLAVNTGIIPPEEILRGFQLEIAPPKLAGIATIEQRERLAQMICEDRLPTIPRRKWENLTMEEAAELISSAKGVQHKLSVSVTLVLDAVKRMNREERYLLEQNLQFNPERKIA